MGQTAAELRAELEDRREALGHDLVAIGDRVSPGRMVQRRRAAIGQSFGRARQRVMGTADSARASVGSAGSSVGSSVGGAASSVAGTVKEVPHMIEERTEGAPLAAGMVAFGLGFLASSLLPASRTEERAAARLQPALESAAGEFGTAGQQVAHDLADEAKSAAQDLKATAQDAAQGIKDEATQAAQARTEDAKAAADEVKQTASSR